MYYINSKLLLQISIHVVWKSYKHQLRKIFDLLLDPININVMYKHGQKKTKTKATIACSLEVS